MIGVYVDDETLVAIDTLARRADRTRSAEVRRALRVWLEQHRAALSAPTEPVGAVKADEQEEVR